MAIMMMLLLGSSFACKSINSLTRSNAEAQSQLSHLRYPAHERTSRLASPDCAVWGCYLLGTMYNLLYQQRLRELTDIQTKHRH